MDGAFLLLQRPSMNSLWKPLLRAAAWAAPIGELALLLSVAGCATDSKLEAGKPVTLIDRSIDPASTITQHVSFPDAFRGFHQDGFPAGKWVVDGPILKSVEGNGVDLITKEKYRDFELDLDWKVTNGANSGILYGVSEATSETYWSGPEYQINDDPHHDDGKVPVTSAGALYDLLAPNETKRLKPTGDWNTTRIISRGGHIEHWLNGSKILEYEWDSPALRALISKTKFSNQILFMKESNGYLALQHHGAEVWFRNIRIIRF